MNKKYLPSKKFVKFISAIVVVGILIWVGSMLLSSKKNFKNKSGDDVKVASVGDSFYTKDTDNDGIYDWEEGLWGTDPNNKDTNNDGVSDGDEINAQKKAIREKNNLASPNESDTKDLNQTEIFARQLFSAASLAKQSGGLSTDSLNSFSKAFGNSITKTKIDDIYKMTDLKLSSIDAKSYKAELAKIFAPYANSGIHAERTIYNLSMGDVTAETDIEKLSKIYHDISNALITSPAPYIEAGTHLSLANTTAKMSVALLNIKNFSDDPVLASVGLHQYEQNLTELENSFALLQSYFSANGIIN